MLAPPSRNLFWIGLAGILGLAIALVSSARAVDLVSRGWEEEQVAHGIVARQNEMETAVAPQMNWDEAVENLDLRFSEDWAGRNLAAYLHTLMGVEWVYVLDGQDRPIFASVQGRRVSNATYARIAQAASPIVEDVRRQEARRGPPKAAAVAGAMISRPIHETHVARIDGDWSGVVAHLVQPDFGTVLPSSRAPIVITGRRLDPGSVRLMADRYRIAGARLAPLEEPRRRDEAIAAIKGHGGVTAATLRWTPRRPGTELLRVAGPYAGVAVLLLIAAMAFLQIANRRAWSRLVVSETNLRIALERVEAADRAKGTFLSAVSHELRTPLNSILGVLHLLKSEGLSRDGAKLLDLAITGSHTIATLVNNILDVTADSEGEPLLSPHPTALAPVIASVAAEFAPTCAARGVDLHTDISPSVGSAVIDEARFRQCLHHLVANAVKFTASGRISIRAAIRPGAPEPVLSVDVEDTGSGMTKDLQATIFERFTQGDAGLTRRFGGVGIGLSITRRLARAMGGDVQVASEEGQGSTFTLTVAAPPAPAAADDGLDAPLQGLRVLIVDDNCANLVVATKIVEQLGASTVRAESGIEALELCRREGFDVILMDIQMPVMDGVETVRRLRADPGANAAAAIIALTANVLPEQCEAYLAAGMNGVASKPISPQAMFAEIIRVLCEQDAAQDPEAPEPAEREARARD